MKKLTKIVATVGGIFVLSEVFSTLGQGQAFAAMHGVFPEETDEILTGLKDCCEKGRGSKYRRAKVRAMIDFAEWSIEDKEK